MLYADNNKQDGEEADGCSKNDYNPSMVFRLVFAHAAIGGGIQF